MSYSDLTTEIAERRGRGRVTTARGVLVMLVCGCLAAAVLGSGPLLDWADDAADRTGIAELHDAAHAWNAALTRLGLTKGYATVREHVRAAEQGAFESPPHD